MKTYCVFFTDYQDKTQFKFVDANSIEDAKSQISKLNYCMEVTEIYLKVWEK